MRPAKCVRDAAVVLGIGRSGSSLLAAVLERMGCAILQPQSPANVGNPRGYFESADVLAFNESLLATIGIRWNHSFLLRGNPPRPLSLAQILQLRLELPGIFRRGSHNPVEPRVPTLCNGLLRDRWRCRLERLRRTRRSMLAIKDPRITLLIEVWQHLLDDTGLNARFVLNVRHPAAVITSLGSPIYRMSPQQAELLWLERYLLALRRLGRRITCVVHYGDWFAAPNEQFSRLLSAMRLRPVWRIRRRLGPPLDLIDRQLDHGRASRVDFSFGLTNQPYGHLREQSIAETVAFAESVDVADLVRSAASPVGFALGSVAEATLLRS